jgi:hypothetical protein
VTKVLPGVGADATEEGPPDAAGTAVINADLVFDDDLAPGRRWASMRLLKQRRAFAAQIVSTTTVMDKSTQSLFRVKYSTKNGRPCGTA